jgi:septal ring factor EnvC (AmiA/AmiB activator)
VTASEARRLAALERQAEALAQQIARLEQVAAIMLEAVETAAAEVARDRQMAHARQPQLRAIEGTGQGRSGHHGRLSAVPGLPGRTS